MTKKELIEILEKVKDDSQIMLAGSYSDIDNSNYAVLNHVVLEISEHDETVYLI